MPDQDDDLFFDVLEALDELVVLPRAREHHGYAGCLWHYRDFSHQLGQRVFRFEVNQILSFAGVPYRIATSGDDIGSVVATRSDELAPLLESAASRPGDAQSEVRHAVSLFRARGATRDEKRSAIVSLARILERNRPVLEAELKGAESALFNIANNFDLRHARDQQHSRYDAAFLDWIFWWYLATVELIEALPSRSQP